MSGPRLTCRLAGRRFAVPMSGRHVRRVFDEWCRRCPTRVMPA